MHTALSESIHFVSNARPCPHPTPCRDDPTILAWELANEPHTTDLFELSPKAPTQFGDQGVTIGRGQLVGRLVGAGLVGGRGGVCTNAFAYRLCLHTEHFDWARQVQQFFARVSGS